MSVTPVTYGEGFKAGARTVTCGEGRSGGANVITVMGLTGIEGNGQV